MDSDDEMVSYYLEACDAMIAKYPNYKLFNFGSIHITGDYKAPPRGPFQPKKLEVGHEVFGGGTIVNGTFIFHRDIYKETGGVPHGIITPDQEALEKIYGRKGQFYITSPIGITTKAGYWMDYTEPEWYKSKRNS